MKFQKKNFIEMFYLNSTLNFGILPVMVFQWEVYYMEDRLLSGLAAHIDVAISVYTCTHSFFVIFLQQFVVVVSLQVLSAWQHNNKLTTEPMWLLFYESYYISNINAWFWFNAQQRTMMKYNEKWKNSTIQLKYFI